MNLPRILIFGENAGELIRFLENGEFDVIKVEDIENIKGKISEGDIGVLLVEDKDKDEVLISSLYKSVIDVSPDTRIILFGDGSNSLSSNIQWRNTYIKWPSQDTSSIFHTIMLSMLEYGLFKKWREFVKESLSYVEEVSIKGRQMLIKSEILEVLRSFNIELSACRGSREAVNVTKSYIAKMFEVDSFCLMLSLDKHFEILVFNKTYRKDLLKKILIDLVTLNGILMQRALKKEEINSIYVNEKEFNFDFKRKPEKLYAAIQNDVGSRIVFPVIAGGENFGCIAIYSKKKRAFGTDDIRKFSFMAYQLASILLNIKLIKKIRDISIKDALTDLYNRRYFDEILQHEYLRAKRYYFPLSLIMIDIDYFKSVNDTFGHLMGDKVLKELGGLISSSVRQVDIVSRFGGEEFAIILLNTPLEEAANMAERLRNIVEKHEIVLNGVKTSITISAGVSSLKRSTISKDELVEQADMALLKAKAKGRNKVYMYISEKEIKEVKSKGLRERRRYKRISAELAINYVPLTVHTINSGKAISRDISEEGICFKDVQEVPKGEFLLLDFDVPLGVNKKHHIRSLAQIVWNKKKGKRVLMGAKLITLDPEDKAILRNLCVHNDTLV